MQLQLFLKQLNHREGDYYNAQLMSCAFSVSLFFPHTYIYSMMGYVQLCVFVHVCTGLCVYMYVCVSVCACVLLGIRIHRIA